MMAWPSPRRYFLNLSQDKARAAEGLKTMAEDSNDRTVFQQPPQGSLRAGVRLNGIYEVERLIAEGGMGEVYKGVAVTSGNPVAIKLVRPDMSRHPHVMAMSK